MQSNCQFCGNTFPHRKSKRFCSRRCCDGARRGANPIKVKQQTDPSRQAPKWLIDENRNLVLNGLKRCSICDQTKSIKGYRSAKAGLGGVEARCKDCARHQNAEYKRRPLSKAEKAEMLQRRRERERKGLPLDVLREVQALQRIGRKVKSKRAAAKRLAARIASKQKRIRFKPWTDPQLSAAESYRIRYQIDAEFNLKERMRRQINKKRKAGSAHDCIRAALVKGGRSPKYEQMLGYTIPELKDHLAKQFTRGMTWEALVSGKIHIDHIVPVSEFDLSSTEGVASCWALTNLRPMWAKDNIVKSNKREFLI